MASTAISAQGSDIQIDVAVAGTPDTSIANITTYSGFDGESSEIDVTNLLSVVKERLLGLQDPGQFSMEIHPDYSDPGQNDLRAAMAAGSLKTFLLTLPSGDTIQWSGRVKNATAMTGGVDAALSGSVSLTVDTDPVITPAV